MALGQPVTQEAIQQIVDDFAAQLIRLVQTASDAKTWGDANLTEANRAANMLLAWDNTPMTAEQLDDAQAVFAALGRVATWATTPVGKGQPSPVDYFRRARRITR